MPKKISWLFSVAANYLLGKRHYRVEVSYWADGAIVFTKNFTVSLWRASEIDQGRTLRKLLGRDPRLQKSLHRLLNTSPAYRDGKFAVEPICYLGRWHD